MKNNLIQFILKEKINETGIKNSGYTWLDLAKMFNIKEGYSDKQRRKAANDIWRSYKKKNSRQLDCTLKPYNVTGLASRYNPDRCAPIYMDVDGEYREDTPGRNGHTFNISIEKEWFPKTAPYDITKDNWSRKKEFIPIKDPIHEWVESQIQINPQDGIYLIMGCVHVPFTNHDFMRAVLKCAKTLNVKGLVLNGDFLDLNTLSMYDKGKLPLEGITLGYEYEQGNKMLDIIEKELPKNIDKYFIYGNHEDRFWRHMRTIDFSKLKGAIPNPTQALKLKERGFKVYENWSEDEVQLGDLTIIHGEFCNIHSCKSHLDTYKKNILYAHTHRSQMYREGDHVAYNIGSMADFNSKAFSYASKSMKKKWSNGMAIATVVEGKTTVEQITWNKNHFVYGGTIWKV